MSDEAMRAAFEAQWYARPGTPLLWREGDKPDAPYRDFGMNHRWKEWGIAWQAATLAERDRCAALVIDSVKHTRLECLESIRKGETP